MSVPLLAIRDLVRRYRLPRTRLFGPVPELLAVDGVSLAIDAGRSLGVVGESGSGKSTLARAAMALEVPSAGTVELMGQDLNALAPDALRRARRDFQMVFQDPYGSLDPRQSVERIVAEPLTAIGRVAPGERRERVGEALESVGLRPGDLGKFPHEFSGGQRQRIAIARALITRPRLIVADEPVSALDVSVQAQVLNLLRDLQSRLGLTYLLISHDLAVVDHVCDRVAVMYAGRIVEEGPVRTVVRTPRHPYTLALLRGRAGGQTMARGTRLLTIAGSPPDLANLPAGCAFAERCSFAQDGCRVAPPEPVTIAADHVVRCLRTDATARVA